MRNILTAVLLTAILAASPAFCDAAPAAYSPSIPVPTYGGSPLPSNSPPMGPTLCTWYPPTINKMENKTTVLPACNVNDAWLASLEAELGPDTSAMARLEVTAAKYHAICSAKHDLSTEEGKASCRADRENGCTPAWTGSECFSGLGDKIFAASVCEGSDYQKYLVCTAKFVDECGGPNGTEDADGCVWEPLLFYGGIESYNANHENIEAVMGGPLPYGACFPKSKADAAIDPSGQFSADNDNAWDLENLGNPNNMTDFFERRGTCPYAFMDYMRNQYEQKCRALNTISTPTGPYLNTIDYNAIAACQAAGCSMRWTNGRVFGNRGFAVPESFWTCTTDNTIWYMKYYYDVHTDGKVPLGTLLCESDRLQFDKVACEAAAL